MHRFSWYSVFGKETFLLDCVDQRNLIASQWPLKWQIWLFYRVITLLYLIVLFVWAFTNKFMRYQWKFFTMMSHWAFIVFLISYVFKFINVIKYRRWLKKRDLQGTTEEELSLKNKIPSWIHIRGDKEHKGRWILQLSWLLANIANVSAIKVTIGYWWGGSPTDIVSQVLNIQIHGVNAAMAVLETVLCAQPTLLLHFYQPICFFLAYFAFTAFYFVAGGTSKSGQRYIYPNLDWTKPEQLLVDNCLVEIAWLIAIHAIFWLLATLRSLIAAQCKKE